MVPSPGTGLMARLEPAVDEEIWPNISVQKRLIIQPAIKKKKRGECGLRFLGGLRGQSKRQKGESEEY